MKFKLIILFINLILSPIFFKAVAQDLILLLNNDESKNYPISDIRKLTFSNNHLNIHLFNGDIDIYEFSEVVKMSFGDLTNFSEILEMINSEISIFPNPSDGVINISYYIDLPSHVTISITDINGKLVKIINDNYVEKGKHTSIWLGTNSENINVEMGIYFCILNNGKKIISKKFLIQ